MKFKKFLPAVLIGLSLFTLCTFSAYFFFVKEPAQTADAAFLEFTGELFQNEITANTITLHYTLSDPEAMGIKIPAVTFGTYSAEASAESAAALENTKAVLLTFPREELSDANRLTYDILSFQIEQEENRSAFPLYEEVFSPTLGTQAQLPVLLAEYTFFCREDIENYLSLLSQLDLYYESLLQYEREKSQAGLFMSDETADAVISQCEEFIARPSGHFLLSTFEERINNTDFLSEQERLDYIDANRVQVFGHVIPAYELLIAGLKELKGTGINPRGLGYFDRGAEYYDALIHCTTGSGRTTEEIKSLIEEQIKTDLQTMISILSARPQLLHSAAQTIEEKEPQDILTALKQRIQKDFPAVRTVDCQIKYVDASLEDYLSPAFYLTPPLDRMDDHIIYINPAGNYNGLSLFTTLAHEGYPGHLYQTLYESSCSFDPVRNIFYFGGYVEGWATYAEWLSYSYTPLDPDMAALLSANSAVSLGLYARADIGIHYENWTIEDTANFLSGFGITNTDNIHSIFQAIVQEPGNYLKYYLGALEIEQLKERAQAALSDKFVLKNFHEFLLSMGPAPFPVIESYMEQWIEAQ